jgi:hypothetical protein
MAGLNVQIQGERVTDRIAKYKSNFIAAGPKVLRPIARLVAVECARASAPYGDSEGSRKAGEHATAIDILRVYLTPSRVYNSFPNKKHANAFSQAIGKRNYAAAQNIVNQFHPLYRGVRIQAFDGGAAHRAARNSYGRVPANKKPAMIVQTPRTLFTYLDLEVSHVGEGKAGWAACARALGSTRGIPQWVTRHAGRGPSSGSGATENYTGATWHVRLINNVPYSQKILQSGAKEKAIQDGISRFVKGQGSKMINGLLTGQI